MFRLPQLVPLVEGIVVLIMYFGLTDMSLLSNTVIASFVLIIRGIPKRETGALIDQSDRKMTSPRRRHALYWKMSLPENRSIMVPAFLSDCKEGLL
jgi:hypothetical protein